MVIINLILLLQPLIVLDILNLCLSCINLTEKEIGEKFYAIIHKISLITVVHNMSFYSLVSNFYICSVYFFFKIKIP